MKDNSERSATKVKQGVWLKSSVITMNGLGCCFCSLTTTWLMSTATASAGKTGENSQ